MDFSPSGGWRTRVNAIRTARHDFIKAGSIRSLNLNSATAFGGTKVTGHFIVPVVPIVFQNTPAPFTTAQLQDQLFSSAPFGRPYSLKTFYEQLSNGNIMMDGSVFPWVAAPNIDSYYEDGCNGIAVRNSCVHGGVTGVDRFAELIVGALNVASNGPDAATVWAAFDNDGPDGIPNSGDDNGVVDFVTFLQPEQDGACSGSSHIWAHRYVVSQLNGGSMYVTRTPWAGHPGQFIKVNDYTMQSAVGGNSACNASQIMPIGTVAHETGHAFGLPDLYDTGSGSVTEGIGEWGLMGSGNYAKPYSPSRMEAWSMLELGWVNVDTLGASGTVRIDPVTSSDRVLYVGVPNTNEYYLLENRQALESDSAQMNPALPLTGSPGQSVRKTPGLLIWHIDQTQVDVHGFSRDNRVNAGPLHGVALVQADGRNDLGTVGRLNYGDAGDSYPGSTTNRRLTLTSTPASLDNSGRYAGFIVDSIFQVLPAGQMIFRFTRKEPSLFTAVQPGATVSVNGTVTTAFTDVLPAGTTVALSTDSLQAAADGTARFEFRSWSDGGTRTHSYTATAAADTIRASFASQFRVIVQLVNALPGAVATAAAPPGSDLTAGVFVPGGTPIILTANAPEGTVFSGWTGDTTSTNPTLTLPMARAYSVRATFVSQVAVTINAAADALLGRSSLTPEQATYLDARGNHNGTFDLGDFLAFARALGVSPRSAVMQQVLSKTMGKGQ